MLKKLKRRSCIRKNTIKMYLKTVGDVNIIALLVNFSIPFLATMFEVFFWSSLTGKEGYFSGAISNRVVTYIILANIFQDQFNVYTPATTALWEGSIIRYYTRPIKLISQFVYETIGKSWIPKWVMYSLPTMIIVLLCGYDIWPYDWIHFVFFVCSIILAIVIGFEIDIIFSAIAIRLKNGCWAAEQIRNALIIVLSGQLIPLQLLPNKVATILMILPFSSLANAPLEIYIGGEFIARILLQCFWAIIIGVIAYLVFKKSEERMISFGG